VIRIGIAPHPSKRGSVGIAAIVGIRASFK